MHLPAGLGLAAQGEYWFGSGHFDFGGVEGNLSGLLYSLFIALWSVYFICEWKVRETPTKPEIARIAWTLKLILCSLFAW